MQTRRALTAAVVLLAAGVTWLYAQEKQAAVAKFDTAAFAQQMQHAWSGRDAKSIGTSMSRLYNDAGLSKTEALAAIEKMLAPYEKVETHYRVLEFKQFPDTNLGSIKAVFHIQGVRKGEKAMRDIVRTFGYASVIFEDGAWKIYGTQAAASGDVMFDPGSISAKNWPAWGTRLTTADMQRVFGIKAVR